LRGLLVADIIRGPKQFFVGFVRSKLSELDLRSKLDHRDGTIIVEASSI
jgi:hypothetical protein